MQFKLSSPLGSPATLPSTSTPNNQGCDPNSNTIHFDVGYFDPVQSINLSGTARPLSAEEASCYLDLSLERVLSKEPLKSEGEIRIGSTDSFDVIESGARRLLSRGQDGTVYLRHGTFTLTENDGSAQPESFSSPLNGRQDWETCRATLTSASNNVKFSIDLNFGIVPRYPLKADQTYVKYVELVLHDKLRSYGSSGGKYIPRVDLDAIITDDAVAKVINEQEEGLSWWTDPEVTNRVEAKERFIHKICTQSRKLFAMYVYLELTMKSLEQLLLAGATDDDPPLMELRWNPDPDDRRKFDDLVDKQGWFKTFHFRNGETGQHHEVPQGTTVPVSFGVKLGEGAYSVVYEATIDPCHQSFKRVSGTLLLRWLWSLTIS